MVGGWDGRGRGAGWNVKKNFWGTLQLRGKYFFSEIKDENLYDENVFYCRGSCNDIVACRSTYRDVCSWPAT